MTDSNINPPSETTGNALPNSVPGTEVTQSPGLMPETTQGTGEGTGNFTVPPDTSGVGGYEADVSIGNQDYAAAVDYQVDSMSETGSHPEMPIYTESETAHQNLMQDPQYAIATHEHTLNKFADLLEKIVARLNSIEEKLNLHIEDSVGPDPNDPLSDYPEVKQHQNK